MNWDFDRDRPIYLQIQEEIKRAIICAEFPPGGQIPSVRVLAEEAKVTPTTIQRALSELERDGFLVSQRTTGKFVTEDEASIRSARKQLASEKTDAFLLSMSALGISGKELIEFLQTRIETMRKD